MQKPYLVKSLAEFGKIFHVPVAHPQIGVFDMVKSDTFAPCCHMCAFNALCLRKSSGYPFLYGDETYRFRNGSVIVMAPLQMAGPRKPDAPSIAMSSRVLLWTNDVFHGTRVSQMYTDYNFLSYRSNSSLDLNDQERKRIEEYMDKLEALIAEQKEDTNIIEASLLVSNILDVCLRTFKRQYNLFCQEPSGILSKTEHYLLNYFCRGKSLKQGMLKVSDIAEYCGVHENYYGTRFYQLTGIHVKDYIRFWMINEAKTRLASGWVSVESVARNLGFKYTNHFATFFKKSTGMSPTAYQLSRFRELRRYRTELENRPAEKHESTS